MPYNDIAISGWMDRTIVRPMGVSKREPVAHSSLTNRRRVQFGEDELFLESPQGSEELKYNLVGYRGCSAKTKRKGKERFCSQLAIQNGPDGRPYCYYHNPASPKKFGEGHVKRRQESERATL